MRLGTSVLAVLFSATRVAHAARSCPETPTPIQWSLSEFTYDAADPTAHGKAATNAAVGLYLTTGSNENSCYGQWPEAWDGRAKTGELIFFSCINNRGRMDDSTVSFGVDWKNRTIHVAHSYICADGARKGASTLAGASVPLDLDCDMSTDGKLVRCITRQRQVRFTTQPDISSTGEICGPSAPQQASWDVTDYAGLYALSTSPTTATAPSSNQPLFTLKAFGRNDTFKCTVQDGQEQGTLHGACAGITAQAGAVPVFEFDSANKLLVVSQAWGCPGSNSSTR
ncbi:hypothetical protein QBC47DRAFT_403932 [Echria macrotheca]|uniref:Uncharacterized protein n=1 Tax=Echria macrotheca TaxID=438768 RepID=A0AAJ0BA76_9PEZI|nr:hypothetical protein QBC47DRAFT_403932 [Echria macrotheca]